ncbi:organic solute transporter Ostalpha-domain-containing protein [Amylocystis lapponica]|nr:organic solute transporter Ostalpha-domain-containing protein [Amylocystis lapponica]
MVNSSLCPSDNTEAIEQDSFWNSSGADWDAHRVGWLISGVCALVTLLLTAINVSQHCRHYNNPPEQRQIIRILYMPAVYAIISFFSYRFFRSYTYYSLIEAGEICGTLQQGNLLLIEFVAATAHDHNVDNAITRKEKSSMPMPFCFWRYRPSKAYFMYTLKWSVLQYIIIRPLLSIAGIICQALGVLCESGSWSFRTASAYISVIDGVSLTIALYGLIIFYGLTREELKGRRPLAKFLSIKLIVAITFYQSLVFEALEGRVIHGTEYWTETNIANGLNALATCIEMVLFAAFMMWAYSPSEYKMAGRTTGSGRPLVDSINYSDFAREIWGSLKFFVAFLMRKPYTHGPRVTVEDQYGKPRTKMDLGEAFGVEGMRSRRDNASESSGIPPRPSYDENIRLAPYDYPGASAAAVSAEGSAEDRYGAPQGRWRDAA